MRTSASKNPKRSNSQSQLQSETSKQKLQQQEQEVLNLDIARTGSGEESIVSDLTGQETVAASSPARSSLLTLQDSQAQKGPIQHNYSSVTATSLFRGATAALNMTAGTNPSYNNNNNHQYDEDEDESSNATPGVQTYQTARQQEQQQEEDPDYHDPASANVEQEVPLDETSNYIDFLKDHPRQMTFSRKLALKLMRNSWYYPTTTTTTKVVEEEKVSDDKKVKAAPQPFVDAKHLECLNDLQMDAYPFTHTADDNQAPSLVKAWAYFEHVVLPRHVLEPKDNGDRAKNRCERMLHKFQKSRQLLQRAEPGERQLPTKLYSPLFTPHAQLGDFGLGMGLYFSTLRALAVLMFCAGLLNIPNFMSLGDASSTQSSLLLRGSAICTRTMWVPCPDCAPRDFSAQSLYRLGTASNSNGNSFMVALKNECDDATMAQGLVSLATLVLIVVGVLVMNVYLTRMEVAFDEDEQTAQDYSVMISNPPPDAIDPDVWFNFFRDEFDAHVTALTIAVDNDLLVRYLVERRELLRMVQGLLEPGTSLDKLTLARLAAKEERERSVFQTFVATFKPGLPERVARLVALTAKVQGMAQQEYPATNIFVTFETEDAQRRVLTELSVGSRDVSQNRIKKLAKESYAFQGRVLAVEEPEEPNTIRWADLNEKWTDMVKQQAITMFVTICAIVLLAFIIHTINDFNIAWSALAIAISNSLFPLFAKFLNGFEAHGSEDGKQSSLFAKIALFRWVNTAVVFTIVTPFTATVSEHTGLIQKIYALFLAEIVTTNVLQFVDIGGQIKRHFSAPRAKTQDSMNLCFSGAPMELAERYTNMSKIIFLALWYSSIFPGGLFMCSVALFINYFVDRFSLMRSWKRQPHLGTAMSALSRKYFFPMAIVFMAVMSSYYWSAFPYDNLCVSSSSNATYAGTWAVKTAQNVTLANSVVFANTDPSYHYCLQDYLRFKTRSFPFVPKFQTEGNHWMSDEQDHLSTIYGWVACGVMSLVILIFVMNWFSGLQSICRSTYEARGEDQHINFSDVPSICSYIPEVASPVFSYPLLACNVDNIDKELLEWTDPDRPHSFYDLTKDAEVLLRGTDVSSKSVFSTVAHFPPPRK